MTRPYRGRLLLAILTGVIGGLIEPLMVATIVFVYSLIFPAADPALAVPQLRWAPAFLRDWAMSAQQSLTTGTRMHLLWPQYRGRFQCGGWFALIALWGSLTQWVKSSHHGEC